MKIVVYVLMALAVVSIIFNATKLDFNNIFTGDSQIALISVIGSLCVLVLLAILQVSYRIKDKYNEN